MKKQYITPATTVYEAVVQHQMLSGSMRSAEFDYGGRSSEHGVLEADANADNNHDIWN